MSGGWTSGEAPITYQSCAGCGARQYFRRGFCAVCGSEQLLDLEASGDGTVYATSLVCRAATPETRAAVPYNILLVDMSEGFRMMAHGEADLAIGDHVSASFVRFAGRLIPYFARTNLARTTP